MIVGLDFLYFLVMKIQSGHPAGKPRFFPFLWMCVSLLPVIDSILGIVLSLPIQRARISDVNANFYTSVDWWFYASLIISAVSTWAIFDRRRIEIKDRFSASARISVPVAWYGIVISWIVFAVICFKLNVINYWYNLLAATTFYGMISLLAKKTAKKEPAKKGS